MSADFITRSIGELPIHIGDGNYSGKYPKASDFLEKGIPFISASDFLDGRISSIGFRYISEEQHSSLKKGHLKSGDVLIVTRGNGTGDVAWVDEQYDGCNINAQLVLLRSDEVIVHNKFLYYLLSSKEYKEIFVSYSSGSAQPQLPIKALKLVELRLPIYESQVKIASLLSSLDKKIHLNTQTNQTLESIAQAIFKSWLVDFEPVKAKMAALESGGTREQAELAAMGVISGKSEAELAQLQQQNPEHYQQLAETAVLFPSAMMESELGEIPEGWEVKSIYGICDVIYGAPFKSSLFNTEKSGLPLVRIRDLKDESPGVYTEETHPKGYLIQNCDLITGMDGEFRSYIWGGNEAWMNQRICCFRPKKNISTFLLKGFIDPHLNKYEKTATATTVIHLGKGDIDTFSFLDAGEKIFRAFNKATENLIFKLVTNKLENLSLSQLRDSLLPKLLSGEIDLSESALTLALSQGERKLEGANA